MVAFAPRAEWEPLLAAEGAAYVRDADELRTGAEVWRTARGHLFHVPYYCDPHSPGGRGDRAIAVNQLAAVLHTARTY